MLLGLRDLGEGFEFYAKGYGQLLELSRVK